MTVCGLYWSSTSRGTTEQCAPREERKVTGSLGLQFYDLVMQCTIFDGSFCLRIYLCCYCCKKIRWQSGGKTVSSVWSGPCGENKNSLHSLPCYFLVNGLSYCPSASLSVGEDKHRTNTHTQSTLLWHAGFKTSPHPSCLVCQSSACNSLSVLCCTHANIHPHTFWLPHKSGHNCLKCNFLYTHYREQIK